MNEDFQKISNTNLEIEYIELGPIGNNDVIEDSINYKIIGELYEKEYLNNIQKQ